MSIFIYLIIAFGLSAISAFIILPWILDSCYKVKLIGQLCPTGHSIPRLGAAVLMPSSIIGGCIGIAILLESSIAEYAVKLSMQLLGAGTVLIYLIGLLDDIVGVKIKVKTIILAFIALAFPCCHLYLNNLSGLFGIEELSFWAGSLLTVLFVMVIVNAFSFINRRAWVSTVMPTIALLGFCGVFVVWELPVFSISSAAIIGSSTIFLLYHAFGGVKHGTQVFMGSSGNLFLGVVLSYLALKSSMINDRLLTSNNDGFAISIALLFLPCADFIRVVLCKLFRRGSSVAFRHKFLYNKLESLGFSNNYASFAILVIYLIFLLIDAILIYIEVNTTWIVITNVVAFTALNICLPESKTIEGDLREKKRVLFCDNTLWGLINFRGDVIKHFVQQGYDVYLVAPEKEDAQMVVEVPENVTFIPIEMGRTSTSPINDLRYFLTLWKIYGEICPDYCFHYTIKPNIYGSIAAKVRCNACTTAMLAGLGYVFNSKSLAATLARILYRIGLYFTDHLFILNEGNKQLVLDKGLCDEKKIILLDGGEGIDTGKYSAYSNLPVDPVTFTFVGRVLYDKGYAEFIEAAEIVKKAHPDVRFEIWGSLDPLFPNAVPLKRLQYDVGRNVVSYKGFTQQMSDVYNRDGIVVVLPSYHEGMNRALMEACSSGKPIICSRIHGCMEMVQEGLNGYTIPTHNSNALAEALLRYLNLSDKEKEDMGRASRLLAERVFSIDAVVKHYDAIVNGQLDGLAVK